MNVKRVIYMLTIVLLVVVGITYIDETYSRFNSSNSINATTEVAKWKITLKDNAEELDNQLDLRFELEDTSKNVAKNKIAPGVSRKATLILDLTDTEVSVDYNIIADTSALKDQIGTSDIVLKMLDNNNNEIAFGKDIFIPLANIEENKGIFNVNFEFTWNDSETNNLSDTQIAKSLDNLKLPIFVKVKQHIDDSNSEEEIKKITTNIPYTETVETTLRKKQPVNYTFDEQDIFADNPEKGFYTTTYLMLDKDGITNPYYTTESETSKLMYLKVDLSAFSETTNGIIDIELTEQALKALRDTLEEIKQNNNTIILRFVYDNNSTGVVEGIDKFEPSQTMLLKHIEQLGPILRDYASTINVIQIGFYGLWGESYYNTDVNVHTQYYGEAVTKLLEVTHGTEINVALRTPKYYTYYKGIDIENILNDITTSSEDAYRVGIFNDGYGGSFDDLGTYVNREKEIEWLQNQSSHTFYGGEAVVDSSYNESNPASAIGAYNTAMYFIEEAFKLHTSYINWEWNQALHEQWANQIYTGDDKNYFGKSALTYIENHLGYRFVVKEARTYEFAESQGTLPIDITIKNVGFANLVKSKQADIVLTDENGNIITTYENVNINAKDFLSQTTIKKSININLPELAKGNYKVYLRLSNGEILENGNYYASIKFANSNLYNDIVQANYIASFTVE